MIRLRDSQNVYHDRTSSKLSRDGIDLRSEQYIPFQIQTPLTGEIKTTLCILALSVLSMLVAATAVTSAGGFPVAFDSSPDWRGVISRLPERGAAVVGVVARSALVVVHLTSRTTVSDNTAAAELAYKNLFTNTRHLPDGAVYVVEIVYGRQNSNGLYPEYAYVFRRDSSNHWIPRPVSERELLEIECATGRCPNGYSPTGPRKRLQNR